LTIEVVIHASAINHRLCHDPVLHGSPDSGHRVHVEIPGQFDSQKDGAQTGFLFDSYVISMVLSMLFLGHLAQVGLWALLFLYLGEFGDFMTAFYHSTVNFSSLGYGDIVMSEQWRLLGALEASSGVLMLGLSSGTLFAVMADFFSRHSAAKS
jgi:hypothetical protein